jgi:hypothetical protein
MTTPTQGNDEFVKREFDEFKNSSTVQSKKPIKFNWSNTPRIVAAVLMTKSSTSELLTLICNYKQEDWFHARKGSAIFNCDQVNYELKYNEFETNAEHDGDTCYCYENGAYVISKNIFKTICDANVLKVRFGGDGQHYELTTDENESLQGMFRQFYNNVFDSTLYKEDMVLPTLPPLPKSGGCFIATAAMGDYDDPAVMVLRRFRDLVLLPSKIGEGLVRAYYSVSPPIASWMSERPLICKIVKYMLIVPASMIVKVVLITK